MSCSNSVPSLKISPKRYLLKLFILLGNLIPKFIIKFSLCTNSLTILRHISGGIRPIFSAFLNLEVNCLQFLSEPSSYSPLFKSLCSWDCSFQGTLSTALFSCSKDSVSLDLIEKNGISFFWLLLLIITPFTY